eukprot:6203856-Pleurochrysis_carterae.AAC.2
MESRRKALSISDEEVGTNELAARKTLTLLSQREEQAYHVRAGIKKESPRCTIELSILCAVCDGRA